jgi:hypothetical protein
MITFGGSRSHRRALAFAALLALASFAPRARAADAKVQQDLEQAEQALVNLDYDTANKIATRLAQAHGLSHDQVVRTYRLLALTDAVLDKEAASRDAFIALLTFDPNYAGDPNLGPKVQAPFMEAKGTMRAQAVQPGLDATVTLPSSDPGQAHVTTRDPTHVSKKVVFAYRWAGDPTFTTVPVAAGDNVPADITPAPPGTTRLEYYAQALDANDSVVFEVGNPNTPKTATVEIAPAPVGGVGGGAPVQESHSIFASPWFWTVAGVVVAGAGTGIYLAAHKSSSGGEAPPGQTGPTGPGPQPTGVPSGALLVPSLQCGATGRCN